jgi:hypothetical protein
MLSPQQQQQLPAGLATPQPVQRIKRTAKRAGAMHRCFSQRNLAGEWDLQKGGWHMEGPSLGFGRVTSLGFREGLEA